MFLAMTDAKKTIFMITLFCIVFKENKKTMYHSEGVQIHVLITISVRLDLYSFLISKAVKNENKTSASIAQLHSGESMNKQKLSFN